MKKGTGDDPFAEEETDDSDVERDVDEEAEEESTTGEQSGVMAAATASGSGANSVSAESQSPPTSATQSREDLPYLARRQLKNKSVKSNRDQIPFFLRDEVQHGERDLRRAVEELLQQEVNKTDLREAAYVYAQRNPEGVVNVLREWGIEYLE